MPVYTAELYPTAIRNAGVGAGNFAGGAALILVPYISLLVNINNNKNHLLIDLLSNQLSNLIIRRNKIHTNQCHIQFKSSQNKIQSYYLMALLASCSFFGSFVVIFLPESMIQQNQQTKKTSLTNSEEQDEER